MKAISIKQPWASLVAAGTKTVECRTWKTHYRGPLLICSSKGDVEIDDGGENLILPGGMALAAVELVDVRPMTEADLEPAYLPKEWYARCPQRLCVAYPPTICCHPAANQRETQPFQCRY